MIGKYVLIILFLPDKFMDQASLGTWFGGSSCRWRSESPRSSRLERFNDESKSESWLQWLTVGAPNFTLSASSLSVCDSSVVIVPDIYYVFPQRIVLER